MLVRFKSIETESITMFGDTALQLIKMLGASGNMPGAISAEDIPAAVSRLRQQLQAAPAPAVKAPDTTENEEDGNKREPLIALATRAGPLIDLLERAAAGHAPLMWEAA